MLAGDGSAAQYLESSRNTAREFDFLAAQAQIAAYGGRIREASVLYTRAVDMAMARQLRGTASSFWTHVALMDALYGDPRGSRARVQNTLNRAIASSDADSTAPRLRAVTALGLVGSAAEAGALLARAEERYPSSTLVRSLLIPAGRAAIALGRGRAEDTLAALGTDVTAEFGVVAGLIPTYLRGEAFLARRDAAAARREYQKVIDHRGIDPFSVLLPAVRLGIARAWALEGNREQGRQAYSELLRLWQNADRDLPLLVQARAEQAALKTGTPAPPASAVH
jgi:tetratricopeptide (TPR) repeat protein